MEHCRRLDELHFGVWFSNLLAEETRRDIQKQIRDILNKCTLSNGFNWFFQRNIISSSHSSLKIPHLLVCSFITVWTDDNPKYEKKSSSYLKSKSYFVIHTVNQNSWRLPSIYRWTKTNRLFSWNLLNEQQIGKDKKNHLGKLLI